MFNLRQLASVIFVLILTSITSSSWAQIIYGQPSQGGLDLISTHWKMTVDQDEVTVDQFTIPTTAFLPLRENLEARVFIAQSTTTVTQLGQSYDLSGLTDMRVQVNRSLSRDRFLLSVGLNLPTGHKALTLDEEWVVMNYLSQSFLSFPVRRLGGGFGMNLMAGGAKDYGDYRIGASATCDLAGSYEAYFDEGDYKPGNTFSFTVGLQHEREKRVLNTDLTFTASADDELANLPVFSRGEQLAAHIGMSSKTEQIQFQGHAYYHVRGRNTVYDPEGILLQQLKIYGNEFLLSGSLDMHHSTKWFYGPRADMHLIAENEYGFGKATVFGLGGQVTRILTPQLSVHLILKYFTGSTHDGEIDLSGHQTWLSANATF